MHSNRKALAIAQKPKWFTIFAENSCPDMRAVVSLYYMHPDHGWTTVCNQVANGREVAWSAATEFLYAAHWERPALCPEAGGIRVYCHLLSHRVTGPHQQLCGSRVVDMRRVTLDPMPKGARLECSCTNCRVYYW